MNQNNLTAVRGKKSKASDLTSNTETAVDTSVNIVYQKVLSHVCFSRFFGKMFQERRSLPAIKCYGLLFPLLFVLSGCLAPSIKPSISRMNEIHTVLVVPVESPPLEVIPDLIESRFPVYRQYHYQAMPYTVFLDEKIYRNPGGVLIAGLVSDDDSVPVADFHQSSVPKEKSANLEPAVLLPENWMPTFILAQEAVSQLNEAGVKAVLSKHYYRLPIASGDRNANPVNWNNAIGQWYNQDSSAVDYRQPGMEQADAIVEVGIDNYRIFDAQTSLQVLIKLIDPNTRQVIGRISEKTFSVEDSPQTLLSHEAEKFKQLVAGMGEQLITRGFSGLGLALKVAGRQSTSVQSTVDALTP
ncbi:MAG: hypothetical protein ACU88J_05905 [Gammaproteobacteria bacterium]